jgi:hypothetical protein
MSAAVVSTEKQVSFVENYPNICLCAAAVATVNGLQWAGSQSGCHVAYLPDLLTVEGSMVFLRICTNIKPSPLVPSSWLRPGSLYA